MEQTRARLEADSVLGVNVSLVRWNRFDYEVPLRGYFTVKRWTRSRVLDKLNVLGAPYKRVVWLDTDVILKRNVDHLCHARPNLAFAAGLNHGHEPRTCWTADGRFSDECKRCRHHGVHQDELRGGWWVRAGMAEQAAGNRSGMPPCIYEFNTG
eukprot:691802-Prymnesium_polylepis.1